MREENDEALELDLIFWRSELRQQPKMKKRRKRGGDEEGGDEKALDLEGRGDEGSQDAQSRIVNLYFWDVSREGKEVCRVRRS
ncbi:hypothetical protein AAC387_Pa02g2788 [Persea americana]